MSSHHNGDRPARQQLHMFQMPSGCCAADCHPPQIRRLPYGARRLLQQRPQGLHITAALHNSPQGGEGPTVRGPERPVQRGPLPQAVRLPVRGAAPAGAVQPQGRHEGGTHTGPVTQKNVKHARLLPRASRLPARGAATTFALQPQGRLHGERSDLTVTLKAGFVLSITQQWTCRPEPERLLQEYAAALLSVAMITFAQYTLRTRRRWRHRHSQWSATH